MKTFITHTQISSFVLQFWSDCLYHLNQAFRNPWTVVRLLSHEVKWKSPKPLRGFCLQLFGKEKTEANGSSQPTVSWSNGTDFTLPTWKSHPLCWLQLTHMEAFQAYSSGPDFSTSVPRCHLTTGWQAFAGNSIIINQTQLPHPNQVPLLLYFWSSFSAPGLRSWESYFIPRSSIILQLVTHIVLFSFITSFIYTSFSLLHIRTQALHISHLKYFKTPLRPLMSISTC